MIKTDVDIIKKSFKPFAHSNIESVALIFSKGRGSGAAVETDRDSVRSVREKQTAHLSRRQHAHAFHAVHESGWVRDGLVGRWHGLVGRAEQRQRRGFEPEFSGSVLSEQ